MRLHNTRLTGAQQVSPEDIVARHGAMQAQDYGPAKWSIGQRMRGVTDADIETAVHAGAILRTHVLRPTWHFVARDDIRWLLALSGPRVHKQIAPRHRQLGLDTRTLSRAEKVIASNLAGGHHLTRDEIGAILDEARIDRTGQRFPHILMHCELEALICSGEPRGNKQTHAAFDERAGTGGSRSREDALVELARRYLNSHGPATVRDLVWWSGLTTTDVRSALEALGSDLQSTDVDGQRFWWLDPAPNAPRVPAPRGVHLLQTYDEMVVGYTQSRFFGDPFAGTIRDSARDTGHPKGVVLVDGKLAGRWRRTLTRSRVELDVRLYRKGPRVEPDALQKEAARLGRFLGVETVTHTTRI